MAVKFYLDSRPNKEGEYPIRVAIHIRCQKVLTSIGLCTSPDVWNDGLVKSKKYVNSKGYTGTEINALLKKIENHFFEYEHDLKNTRPSVEDMKAHLKIAMNNDNNEKVIAEKKKTKVFDNLKQFMDEERIASQWAYSTYQCWITFSHHLLKFNKKVKYEYFNESGINKFVHFLRVTQNLEEKTVQKQFNNLKWFLNWAIRKGYCKEEFINKYRPKFKILAKPVIFLTKEELLKLYEFDIPANGTIVTLMDHNGQKYEKVVHEAGALAKTRDLFCFCCFTSLRYSDMANLRRTDIMGDTLYITTQKTNDRLPINLNSFSKEILDKYSKENFPGGLALPVITNQKMNYYLKDLCELCGFNSPVTSVFYRAGQRVEETHPKWSLIGTHAGRRTFICFALSSGIPPQIVMKWSGHSDYKAMKPYIDIAETTKVEAMNIFDENLRKR